MPLIKEFKAGGRKYELYGLSGKVVNSGKTSSTHTYTTGGGYNSSTGQYDSTNYHTYSEVRDQIFILDKNGKEHAIQLTNWNVPVRDTHDLTAYWAIAKGKKTGPYIAILNHSVDKNLFYNDLIKRMFKPRFSGLILLAFYVVLFFITRSAYYSFLKKLYASTRSGGRSSMDVFMGLKIIGAAIVVAIVSTIVYKIVERKKVEKESSNFKNELLNINV